MKKRIYFAIICLVILGFSLVMGFVLNTIMPLDVENAQLFYWITKGFVLFCLLGLTIYLVFRKQEVSNAIIVLGATLLLQFLPLGLRVLLRGDEPMYIWASILVFVVIISYLAVFFSTDILNDKVTEVIPKLEGKSIKVVDEATYDDSDGRFKGAMDKKVK
jgi:putative effector of murein hydrolase LrgA (UPF0299 family)